MLIVQSVLLVLVSYLKWSMFTLRVNSDNVFEPKPVAT